MNHKSRLSIGAIFLDEWHHELIVSGNEEKGAVVVRKTHHRPS